MMGTRISTASDFPHTAVYERDGPNGHIYTVAFNNKEYAEGWRQWLLTVGVLVLFSGGLVGCGIVTSAQVPYWMIVWTILFIAWVVYFKEPWKVKRAIELDFGTDQLRVLRNRKVEASRQLTRLANLTVDEHPDAEAARVDRTSRGERKPSRKEKQHCLMGWFGTGGAEQVMLVSRAEWPNHNSLFEVRQAVLWAIEKASSKARGSPGFEPPAPIAQTIKPPLD